MNEIRLAPQYLPLVLNRSKTTTIRRGLRNFPLGAAMIRTGAGDAPVVVTGINFVRLDELTSLDANADGFGSVAELRNALSFFYPKLKPDEPMTIVRFDLS
jgi:hypothetical protein